jgi:hypothetical protein
MLPPGAPFIGYCPERLEIGPRESMWDDKLLLGPCGGIVGADTGLLLIKLLVKLLFLDGALLGLLLLLLVVEDGGGLLLLLLVVEDGGGLCALDSFCILLSNTSFLMIPAFSSLL